MKIVEIAFSSYPVTDLKRARHFYEAVLGLTAARSFGDENHGVVEYDIGNGTLGIGNGVDLFQPSRHGGMVVLEVEDFDAAVAHLRAQGVPFRFEPFATPVCRGVAIADPDGNTLMIHRRN